MENPVNIDKKIIERGLWLATHRLAIKRWLTIGLYTVIALSFVVFFIQFGVYVYRLNEWNRGVATAVEPFIDWTSAHQATAPADLILAEPVILARGPGVYDLAVEAHNPNTEWAGSSVEYQFMSNDEPVGLPLQTFILPGQKRFFTLFGYQTTKPLTSVRLAVNRMQWQRVGELPPLSWIWHTKPVYTGRKVIVNGREQATIPARVGWQVQNGSTYSVNAVVWQIALYTGGRLATMIEYTSGRFPFLDIQTFDVVVSQSLPRVDSVVVIPLVNIFDPNFSYLEGEP